MPTSGVDHYTLLRLWKEFVLVLLMVPVWYILWNNTSIRTAVLHSRLLRAIAAFLLLQVVIGVVALLMDDVSLKAFGYALVSNTRYLLFFVLVAVLARECSWLHWHWRLILLGPAIVVVAVGLLQYFVLPGDVLKHFGYGPETIPAVSLIDNKPDYQRIQSTLRGANPLGAYLVVIIAALTALILKHKHYREWRIVFLAAALFVLFASSSRSSWIGALIAIACVVWFWLKRIGADMRLLAACASVAVVLGIFGIIAFRNNDFVQNYVFHTDEHSISQQSSNSVRAENLREGLTDVVHHPLGGGPGTAGPASVYNNAPAKISENYFLQIGREVGWLGLLLYIFILVGVIRHLWLTREQTISVTLLASLLGLLAVNMLSHAWTDDTLAYIWWGMAGIALAPSVLGDRKKEMQHEATKKA